MKYLTFDVGDILDKYDRHPVVYELLPELSVQSLITIVTGAPVGPGGFTDMLLKTLTQFYQPTHWVWSNIDAVDFLLENISTDVENTFVQQGLYQLVEKVPYFVKWLNYQTLVLGAFDESVGNHICHQAALGAVDRYLASLPFQLPRPA